MKAIRTASAVILSVVIMVCFGAVTAFASSTTLKVSGTYYYDKAQDMLVLVNAERASKGLGALTLDKELTAAAMQRAAEISVDFDHNRPDGRSCFTVSDKAGGENIAANWSLEAKMAFEQWKDSPGHYANMMEEGFKSIGIGVFYGEGFVFWVQLFSWYDADKVEMSNAHTAVTADVAVELGSSSLYLGLDGTPMEYFESYNKSENTFTIEKGNSLALGIYRENPGWGYVVGSFDASGFSWTSSNTGAATVDSSGNVTAKSAGTAVITASSKTGSDRLTLNVKVITPTVDISKASVTLSGTNFTYDGTAKTPSVTVKYGGSTLKNGTDYTVSYSSNVNAGTAKVTVTGKGSYTGSVTRTFTISPKPAVTTRQTTTTTRRTTVTAKQTTTRKETVTSETTASTAPGSETAPEDGSESVTEETELTEESGTETSGEEESIAETEETIVTTTTTTTTALTEAAPVSEESIETASGEASPEESVSGSQNSTDKGMGALAIAAVCTAGAAVIAGAAARIIRRKKK